MNKRAGQISVALVLLILGLMLSIQYRTIQYGGSNVSVKRIEDLTTQLKNAQKDKEVLTAQVNTLQDKLSKYENSASKVTAVVDSLKEDNTKYKILAGLTPVHGPGVVVTMTDSTQKVQPGQDPSAYLIHDVDLLQVINELKAAGAEAFSINEQRLVSTSEVRCVGPTIDVNTERFAPPFVIKAIGNPQTLQAALELKGGIVEALKYMGIQVNIKTADNVSIPAYNGTIQFKYAKPDTSEGGSK